MTRRSGGLGRVASDLRSGWHQLIVNPGDGFGRPPGGERTGDPNGDPGGERTGDPNGDPGGDPNGDQNGDQNGPGRGDCGPRGGAGPFERRRPRSTGRNRWYAGALVGLSFLVIMMVDAATSGGSVGDVVTFEVLSAGFAAVYMFAPVWAADGFAGNGIGGNLRRPRKLAVLAAMIAISVPMIVVGGTDATAVWIYVGVVAALLFSLRWTLAIAMSLATAMLLVSGLAGDGLPWELALTLVALALWMAGFAGNIRLTVELRDTREDLARAAVAAERARIGRDLHDILGHSLTAIAVKAGLARRLLDRDAVAAGTEIADVERLARDALSDVRATAAGYRDVSVATEIAVARSVLAAAGIHADLPTAVDDVSPAGRQVFGYVVREAVTNVVRHSGARRCAIELRPDSVEITDDGRGIGGDFGRSRHAPGVGDATGGRGLRGLAERMVAAGGTLQSGPVPGGGFRVLAALPNGANR